MSPAVEGLINTARQTFQMAIVRLSQTELTDEQVDQVVTEFKEAVGCGCGDLDPIELFQAAKMFNDFMFAPHKRDLLKNRYNTLDTQATLSFDEFVEYNEGLENLAFEFMADLQPIIQKVFEERILPKLKE